MRSVEGWLDDDEAELLIAGASRALSDLPVWCTVVEIGSYMGRSTTVLGSVARAVRPGARVYAIDPHQGLLTGGQRCSMLRVEPTLDAFRRTLDIRQKLIDHRDNTTTTFEYDHRGRLKRQETKSNSTGAVTKAYSYRYDANSNRLEAGETGAATKSYAYNEANELCWVYSGSSSNGCSSPPSGATTFQYDRNGNTTSSSDGYAFAYNASNHTTSITPPGGSANALSYFGVGQSELESRTGETYSHSLLGLMQDGAERYARDNQGQPLVWNDAGAWNYLLHDNHPGSSVAATDGVGAVSARYSYDPFGVVKSATGSQSELLFADGQYHAGLIKLYRFGERWYNPALGRWTQQDPLHQPFDPREANRYSYVGGDPVNLTDPSGTHILEDAKDFVEDKADDVSDWASRNKRKIVTTLHGAYLAASVYATARACAGGPVICAGAAALSTGADYYVTECTDLFKGSYLRSGNC